MDRPDEAWLCDPRDAWVANPYYSGPPVSHPEDNEHYETPDAAAVADAAAWSAAADAAAAAADAAADQDCF